MKGKRLRLAALLPFLAATLALVAGGTAAHAATNGQLSRVQLDALANPTLGGNARAACVSSVGHLAWFEMSNIPHTCAFGLTLVTWGATGPVGPQGKTGPQGPQGPQGKSGVQAISTPQSFATVMAVPTGGSFLTKSVEVGTVPLAAGTYEVCVSGQVEQPTAATGSVSAQLFLYDQAKSAAFTGDLMNLSTDPQGGTKHDAYMNGCTLITEGGAVTLHLYGFGYDSDQGSGEFNLITSSIKLVQLTPAA